MASTKSVVLNAHLIVSLGGTSSSVTVADSLPVDWAWGRNNYPVPSESFSRASSVSLLADLVSWVSQASSLPGSTVSSVVESWRSDNLNPVPAESSGRTTGVPVLAVAVVSLSWTERSVSSADQIVVDSDWSDDDPAPSKSSG